MQPGLLSGRRAWARTYFRLRHQFLDLVQSRVDSLGCDRQLEQLTTDGIGNGIRDGGCRGVVGQFPNGLCLIRSLSAARMHEDGL